MAISTVVNTLNNKFDQLCARGIKARAVGAESTAKAFFFLAGTLLAAIDQYEKEAREAADECNPQLARWAVENAIDAMAGAMAAERRIERAYKAQRITGK